LIQSRFGVRSRVTDEVRAHMLALVEAQADITIASCATRFTRKKAWRSVGLSRKTGQATRPTSQKKSIHAIERDSEATVENVRVSSAHLDHCAERLIFLDESGVMVA